MSDSDDVARVDPFFRTLVADAKQHGYGEYRTHLDYMDLVADTYDFNNGAMRRLNEKVKNALDVLEKDAGSLGDLTTIGEIAIGCALGYLDFRYANEPWRPGHPKLEAWYAKVVKLPPLAETMPVG